MKHHIIGIRIFQELMTNIVRHAKASAARIVLKSSENQVTLRVSDNGVGITQDQIEHPDSFGLMGIKERLLPWNGLYVVLAVGQI